MNVADIAGWFAERITIDHIICLAGLILLACWLLRTSLGRAALADSPPRQNNMPSYMPFIPLFIWFGAYSATVSIIEVLLPNLHDWWKILLSNITLCVSGLIAIAVIIFLARASFAQRLKGFGLNPKTIPRDFFAAFLNLLSVWPLVLLMMILTIYLINYQNNESFPIHHCRQDSRSS